MLVGEAPGMVAVEGSAPPEVDPNPPPPALIVKVPVGVPNNFPQALAQLVVAAAK